MSSETSIYTLLKSFSVHQNSATVLLNDFQDYVRRHAQKHANEQTELVPFMGQSTEPLVNEIALLSTSKKISSTIDKSGNEVIFVIPFIVNKLAAKYKEIANNPTIPFPLSTDLSKKIPQDVVQKQAVADFLTPLFEGKTTYDEETLFGLVMPREMPVILFPSSISVNLLLDISMNKIRTMLHKDEYHDYFLKKLKISNPGKEISVKNFFTQFVTKPVDALETLKNSGDAFYFWSQLCFFIRQDYEKVKDYTAEDIAILQSVIITEIAISFFKNKSQQNAQRQAALKTLENHLSKPPYYFDHATILKFTDSKGVPLIGQYSEEDLSAFLKEKTTKSENNELPELLTFKAYTSDQRFYIEKTKVLQLIVRLCSDARETLKDKITKEWYEIYQDFDSVPEMSNQNSFELKLEQEVKTVSPILYALLNSNFLSLVHYEARMAHDPSAEKVVLFSDGKLLPYSELLMLSRHEIVTDARILLPFWYTTPIISWFVSLFLRPSKKDAQKRQAERKRAARETKTDEYENQTFKSTAKSGDRKKDLVNAARALEEKIIPQGSTLDRELHSYEHQWNMLINKKLAEDLTEDVNSLIRDYVRKTIRTLQGSSFTDERVRGLAESLAKTPSLQRIKDQEELTMYIQLYIIKLVKNL
ncbi:MAG: hypothetical protein J5747_11015 [Spirochaetaceae bacterium]|nr:hypothetical protein [Spirochaetaceae bacterium]